MVKRTIRNYGKGNDLVDVDDIARMLNRPENQPADESWASERYAIVLPPIEHSYQNVSSIPGIKKFSCFTTIGHNRTMMKPLPCGRPCCMSFTGLKMLLCPYKHMTGSNDKERHGQAVVHHRIPEPKKSKIAIVLNKSKQPKKKKKTRRKTPAAKFSPGSRPVRRKAAEYATAEISAQTRKGRLPHADDKQRYAEFSSGFEFTKHALWSMGSLYAPSSPLHPSESTTSSLPALPPASTPATPAVPTAPANTEPSALRRTSWTRGGGRKKKRRNRRGGGRPANPTTKLRKTRKMGGK